MHTSSYKYHSLHARDFIKNYDELAAALTLTELDDKLLIEPSPGNGDIDLEYYIEELHRCSKVKGYLEFYDFLRKYYVPRFNLLIYSLLRIAGSIFYVLILLCNHEKLLTTIVLCVKRFTITFLLKYIIFPF